MNTNQDNIMEHVDVVVVGLGPTGATLSGLLAQRGIRVAAFDKLPDLFPLPRAIGLDHEAMRVMQELQIAGRIEPHVAPYRPSEYRGVSGGLIKRLDMAPGPHLLGWVPNYVFNQPAFERELRKRLDELPAVQTYCGAEVLSWEESSEGVRVQVRLADGQLASCFGRFLVACDGGASRVRKSLGIDLEDLGFDEPWLVVDAIVNDDKLAGLPQTQVQYCEPERPSTFVVLPGNHRRWELMLLPGDSLSEDFPESELWPLLARWIKPGDAKLWRAAAYRFHGLVARQWRKGRFLLAGDSAHMTPPFMAQGMVQGLRDAQNLAWKLARVLAGSSPAELLDTYQQERREHVVATTRAAMALGKVICERDPERARERDARMLAEQGGQVVTTFRQNMIPELRSGLIAAHTPAAGRLFPQPLIRTAGYAGRLDGCTGPVLRVVTTESIDARDSEALQHALSPFGGVLVLLGEEGAADRHPVRAVEDPPLLGPWLRGLDRRFVVVRPDHYVYATAATAAETIGLINRLGYKLRHPATSKEASLVTTKDDILTLEHQRRQAMIAADVDALDKLFADELLWIHGSARTDGKRGMLDSIASRKTIYQSIDCSEETIRFCGDTALVSGISDMKVCIAGMDRLLKNRFTIAWAQTDGEWQVVNWQSTPVPDHPR